jgi:hypothetical protein
MSILYDASLHNLLLSIKKLCKVLHKFFKWIKQHLKIKSFCGTTENAVRIQIFSALIAYNLRNITDFGHIVSRQNTCK